MLTFLEQDSRCRRLCYRRYKAWFRYCQVGGTTLAENCMKWVMIWDKAYHKRELELKTREDCNHERD